MAIGPGNFGFVKKFGRGLQKLAGKIVSFITSPFRAKSGDAPDVSINELETEIQEEIAADIENVMDTLVIPAIRQALIDRKHVFKGDLINSLRAERISGTAAVKLSSGVGYLNRIEFGTTARAVDDDERERLIEWAAQKFNLPEERAERVGLAVADKITKVGNQPHPFLQAVFDDLKPVLEQELGGKVSFSLVDRG